MNRLQLSSGRLLLCFDWPLHIGRLPRSPSQNRFPTYVFKALVCFLFSAYTQPLAGSLQCAPPPPLAKLASPPRLDTQTPFAGYFSVSSCILLFLFCLLSRILNLHIPFGSIIADPNHGLAVSPFFDHFIASRYVFSPDIYTLSAP